MITPVEVNKKEFKVKFKGYDVVEVDDFLDELSKDYEKLYKDNIVLKERLEEEEDDHFASSENHDLEETLKQTLILAQRAADEAKKNANDRAAMIINMAEIEASKIMTQAAEKERESQHKVDQLENVYASLLAKMKGLISSYSELLNSSENDFRYK